MARTSVFVVASLARFVAVFLHVQLIIFAWIGAIEIVVSELALATSYLRFASPCRAGNGNFP